jgi:hypothetical protein
VSSSSSSSSAPLEYPVLGSKEEEPKSRAAQGTGKIAHDLDGIALDPLAIRSGLGKEVVVASGAETASAGGSLASARAA